MKQATRIVSSPATLIMVLVAAALLLGPAYATWLGPPAQPAIVAGVDLEKVFNEIDRRADAEANLERFSEQLEQKLEGLRLVAEQAKMDMDMLVPGTDKYAKAEDVWTQAVLDYSAYVEFRKAKLDAKRADARREIYQAIVDEAAKFAAANGVDYILADDSTIGLLQGTDLQIVQQMSLRRLVYSNPSYDVTDDLIAWINQM
ncbi:MAG: OmpH/Skp family outer membrane protein [Planctomycetota bacterium]|jgi:Skp family chaperone for outer membrane proteins